MNMISGIDVTASALNAEKTRMDVVAQNIANADTTRDTDGRAYQRKVVSFESVLDAAGSQGVQVSKISNDKTQGETVYEPGHPDANKDGMVQMPNVHISTEMVDLMSSSRAYEANLSVVRNAKQMATKALSIGK
jgi:flagellar basal-body rod protein FlgC